MDKQRILGIAQSEQANSRELFHSGVAARVLGAVEHYPAMTGIFEHYIEENVGIFVEELANEEGRRRASEQLRLLAGVFSEIREGKALDAIVKQSRELQKLLPYNFTEVNEAIGASAALEDIVVQYRVYATLDYLAKYGQAAADAPLVKETAITLGRLAYDFGKVLDDILTAIPPKDAGYETLGSIAPTLSPDQLVDRIRGDYPNTDTVEEDIVGLCGGFLRPLHYQREFWPIVKQPGSVVWSTAALALLVTTTTLRADVAQILATAIARYARNEPPYLMSDQPLHQLYFLGTEALRDYYASHPPATPPITWLQPSGGGRSTEDAARRQADAQPSTPASPAGRLDNPPATGTQTLGELANVPSTAPDAPAPPAAEPPSPANPKTQVSVNPGGRSRIVKPLDVE